MYLVFLVTFNFKRKIQYYIWYVVMKVFNENPFLGFTFFFSVSNFQIHEWFSLKIVFKIFKFHILRGNFLFFLAANIFTFRRQFYFLDFQIFLFLFSISCMTHCMIQNEWMIIIINSQKAQNSMQVQRTKKSVHTKQTFCLCQFPYNSWRFRLCHPCLWTNFCLCYPYICLY